MENKIIMKKLYIKVLLDNDDGLITHSYCTEPLKHNFTLIFDEIGKTEIDESFRKKYKLKLKYISIEFQEGDEETFFKLANYYLSSFKRSICLPTEDVDNKNEIDEKLDKFIANNMFLYYTLKKDMFKKLGE